MAIIAELLGWIVEWVIGFFWYCILLPVVMILVFPFVVAKLAFKKDLTFANVRWELSQFRHSLSG